MKKKFNVWLKNAVKTSFEVMEDKYEERDFGIIVIVEENGVRKYTIPWENIQYIEEKIS